MKIFEYCIIILKVLINGNLLCNNPIIQTILLCYPYDLNEELQLGRHIQREVR